MTDENITAGGEIELRVEEAKVVEAVSPRMTVARVTGGVEVSVTDYQGTTSAPLYDGAPPNRVTSLTNTPLAGGTVVEAVGIPVYIGTSDLSQYSAYGLTETGWYVLARIAAKSGVKVTAETTVTGAAGVIATVGAGYVDVAVKFEVAAVSQAVTVAWGAETETFVFKATDLAVRNLDYRTTFYLYDIAPYAAFSFALTADAAFAADKDYYTEAAGEYTKATVTATDPVPAFYKDAYALTTDTTFQDGKTYFTESGGEYTAATVTTGEAVTEDTYYEHSYVQATGEFEADVTYYTLENNVYTEATVTTGEAIPAYYNHSKVRFEGMTRNVTYKFDQMIDCPVEIALPEVDDADYGAWFEIQLRYNGSYSCTLLPPEGVLIGTVTTQGQTAGINVIDLQYTGVGGVQMWSLLNTHSNIPTT